jgi:Tat protein translocase TatB subunit
MGFGEVVLILIVALFVFGPHKLPEIARELGKGARWLKKSYTDFKVAITQDITENGANKSSWNKKQG